MFEVSDKTLSALGITSHHQLPQFRALVEQSKPEANVVLMGRTGAGKSSLVNGLCGAVVVDSFGEEPTLPVTKGSHTTACYQARETTIYLGATATDSKTFSINVWDSPGLFDGKGNEREYVLQVKEKCDPDLLLYCIDMREGPLIGKMIERMKIVTESLGQDVWKYAIIVLTFANCVPPSIKSTTSDEICHDFIVTVYQWENEIREALIRSGVDEIAAHKVVIEPAGFFANPNLPDREHWLGYLWLQVMKSAHPSSKLSILLNTQDQVNNSEYLSPNPIVIDERVHAGAIDSSFGPIKGLIPSLSRRSNRGN